MKNSIILTVFWASTSSFALAPAFESALSQGFIRSETQEDAKNLFRQALMTNDMEAGILSARYGFVNAMHFLGTKSNDKMHKVMWFSLAIQVYWLNNGAILQNSMGELKKLFPEARGTKKSSTFKNGSPEYFAVNFYKNFERFDGQDLNPCQRMNLIFELLNLQYEQKKEPLVLQAFFVIAATQDPRAQLLGLCNLLNKYGSEEVGFLLSMARLLSPLAKLPDTAIATNARFLLEKVVAGINSATYVEKPAYSKEEHDLFALVFEWMALFPENHKFLNSSGLFVAGKLVGTHLTDRERYEEAARLYRLANNTEAFENLAWLYYARKIGTELSRQVQLEQAILLWDKSPSFKARKNGIVALVELSHILRAVEPLKLAVLKLESLAKEHSEDAALELALAQIYLEIFLFNENKSLDIEFLDRAEGHAQNVKKLRDIPVVDFLLVEINEIRSLFHERNIESEAKKDEIDENIPSSLPEETAALVDASKSNRKAEKKARAMRKRQEEFRKLAPVKSTIDQIGESKARNLEIVFLNKTVQSQFQNLSQAKKIREIFDDILLKPWATEGVGKPEVLRTGEYRGCISRRLDHGNRLVYRVEGENKIKIIHCDGHY